MRYRAGSQRYTSKIGEVPSRIVALHGGIAEVHGKIGAVPSRTVAVHGGIAEVHGGIAALRAAGIGAVLTPGASSAQVVAAVAELLRENEPSTQTTEQTTEQTLAPRTLRALERSGARE